MHAVNTSTPITENRKSVEKTYAFTDEKLSKGKTVIGQGSPIQVLGFLGEKQPFSSDKVKFNAYNKDGKLVTYFAYAKYLFDNEEDWLLKKKQLTALNNNTFPQFARGGLVDFTGPAWVDGTKSKPEAFLSAKDTALLKSKIFSDSDYSLRSVIEAIQGMSNSFGTINNSSVSGGITIENVTVEVQPGVISSDYDARRAGEMALEEIVKVARRSTNLNAMRR